MKTNFTILIADRNPHVRNLLKRELEEEGYHVVMAKNDREVLSLVNSELPPALLILDLAIPYGNGIDLIRELKKELPTLPIIIHTLFSDYEQHPELQAVDA